MEEHQKNIMKSSENAINEMKQAFVDSSKNLDDVATKFEQEFTSKINGNIETTIKFIAESEQSLHNQLENILNEYGSKLTALTSKMLELYDKQGNAPYNNNKR